MATLVQNEQQLTQVLDYLCQSAVKQEQANLEIKQANLEIKQAFQQQAKTLARVEEKLAQIEKNTISIMGAIITDFEGITPATKAQIETTGEAALSDPIVQEQIETIKTGQPIKVVKNGKIRAKRYESTTSKEALINLGVSKDVEPRAFGNWAAGILHKATGVRFPLGKYPLVFAPFLENLALFYTTERVNQRKY